MPRKNNRKQSHGHRLSNDLRQLMRRGPYGISVFAAPVIAGNHHATHDIVPSPTPTPTPVSVSKLKSAQEKEGGGYDA